MNELNTPENEHTPTLAGNSVQDNAHGSTENDVM